MKVRVLLLESLPTIAGGQRVLLNMLPAFEAYELHALLPGPGTLADTLVEAGATCHFATMASYSLVHKSWHDLIRFPFDQLRLGFRCGRLAHRLNVHLLYANCSRNFVWATLGGLIAGAPVVWHTHNLIADQNTLKLLQTVGKCSTVKRIIAASDAAANQFPDLLPKTTVVPAGVDTSLFHPDPDQRTRVRQELSIPSDGIAVGIIGDLIPLKGQHVFMDALAGRLGNLFPIVIGEARADNPDSQAYARNLRDTAPAKTVFTGRRQDMPDLLNALDILVVASEQETGPLVLLEAMASGVPVVSTPVGRAPKLLPADALYPVGDTEALAERLRYWIETPGKLEAAGLDARNLATSDLNPVQFQEHVRAEIAQVVEDRL